MGWKKPTRNRRNAGGDFKLAQRLMSETQVYKILASKQRLWVILERCLIFAHSLAPPAPSFRIASILGQGKFPGLAWSAGIERRHKSQERDLDDVGSWLCCDSCAARRSPSRLSTDLSILAGHAAARSHQPDGTMANSKIGAMPL